MENKLQSPKLIPVATKPKTRRTETHMMNSRALWTAGSTVPVHLRRQRSQRDDIAAKREEEQRQQDTELLPEYKIFSDIFLPFIHHQLKCLSELLNSKLRYLSV